MPDSSPPRWNPAYVTALAAENRVADACTEVDTLTRLLPDQADELRAIYNDLAGIRGRINSLAQPLPTQLPDTSTETPS